MTPEQQAKLDELYVFMQSLMASSTIPLDIERALRARLGLDNIPTAAVSSKGADTEDVTVNEAGASSYPVMNDPVGFIQITIGSTTYHIPYFNA